MKKYLTMTDAAARARQPSTVVTITEAARLAGVDRTTINRYARKGKLTKHPDGGIDVAELTRLFPSLPGLDDPADRAPDFEEALTGDERRAALKAQLAPEHDEPLRDTVRQQADTVHRLVDQIGSKDETIRDIMALAERRESALLRQLDDQRQQNQAVTTRLLAAPETQPAKRGLLGYFFA